MLMQKVRMRARHQIKFSAVLQLAIGPLILLKHIMYLKKIALIESVSKWVNCLLLYWDRKQVIANSRLIDGMFPQIFDIISVS